jgi:hypothetical protein
MIIAAIVLAAAAPAPAAPLADPQTTIARIDANKDGGADLKEWLAVGNHEAGFKLMDTDHNGKVTVTELVAFRARPQGGAAAPAPPVREPGQRGDPNPAAGFAS